MRAPRLASGSSSTPPVGLAAHLPAVYAREGWSDCWTPVAQPVHGEGGGALERLATGAGKRWALVPPLSRSRWAKLRRWWRWLSAPPGRGLLPITCGAHAGGGWLRWALLAARAESDLLQSRTSDPNQAVGHPLSWAHLPTPAVQPELWSATCLWRRRRIEFHRARASAPQLLPTSGAPVHQAPAQASHIGCEYRSRGS